MRHRADSNKKPIVDGLRKCGIATEIIERPLDLLVNHRFFCPNCHFEIPKGRTVLMEVKNEDTRKDTKYQIEFMAKWPGELYIAQSLDEALAMCIGKDAMR